MTGKKSSKSKASTIPAGSSDKKGSNPSHYDPLEIGEGSAIEFMVNTDEWKDDFKTGQKNVTLVAEEKEFVVGLVTLLGPDDETIVPEPGDKFEFRYKSGKKLTIRPKEKAGDYPKIQINTPFVLTRTENALGIATFRNTANERILGVEVTQKNGKAKYFCTAILLGE